MSGIAAGDAVTSARGAFNETSWQDPPEATPLRQHERNDGIDIMKWVTTGGCGFIGTNAARRFVEEGDEVIVVDATTLSASASARKPAATQTMSHQRPSDTPGRSDSTTCGVVGWGCRSCRCHQGPHW